MWTLRRVDGELAGNEYKHWVGASRDDWQSAEVDSENADEPIEWVQEEWVCVASTTRTLSPVKKAAS